MTIVPLQTYAGILGAMYQRLIAVSGTSTTQGWGTLTHMAQRLLEVSKNDSDDYYVEKLFNPGSFDLYNTIPADKLFQRNWAKVLQILDEYYGEHGDTIDDTINSLQTMLEYHNGGAGGLKFSNMLSPFFNDLMYAVSGARPLEAHYYYGKGRYADAEFGANYMASRSVGGAFVGIASYDANYAELVPLVVVASAFSGGSAPPTVTIAGTDDTGATSTTWSATLTGNNPVANGTTTLGADVNAWERSTVALGSVSGVVRGTLLIVDSGTLSQETVLVENVSGSNITAVFKKDHGGGATVDYNMTYETTPSVSARRIRSVSNITIGTTGHSAGNVAVAGRQERVDL